MVLVFSVLPEEEGWTARGRHWEKLACRRERGRWIISKKKISHNIYGNLLLIFFLKKNIFSQNSTPSPQTWRQQDNFCYNRRSPGYDNFTRDIPSDVTDVQIKFDERNKRESPKNAEKKSVNFLFSFFCARCCVRGGGRVAGKFLLHKY